MQLAVCIIYGLHKNGNQINGSEPRTKKSEKLTGACIADGSTIKKKGVLEQRSMELRAGYGE